MLKISEDRILQKRRAFPGEILKTKVNGWNVNLHSRAMNNFSPFDKRGGSKGVKECENY
jgi:hypothetical protein